jgi:hypothetical protein
MSIRREREREQIGLQSKRRIIGTEGERHRTERRKERI